MRNLIVAACVALLLIGCAEPKSGRDLTTWPNERLLTSVWDVDRNVIDEEIIDEIKFRELVPVQEWSAIRKHEVEQGMTESGVLASLGKPAKSSTKTTWDGVQTDHIFEHGFFRYRVSVKGGVVISFLKY